MRGRPWTTAAVVVAVALAALPMTTLVRRQEWYVAGVAGVAVAAALSWLGRWVRLPAPLVPLVSLLAGLTCVQRVLGAGTGPLGLPGSDVLEQSARLLHEGIATIQRYAAPAPQTPGLAVLLASLLVLAGVCADVLAVTRRAPAAAGFPLLVLYLVAAVNTVGSLPWSYFVLAAVAWLLLVVGDHARAVARFATVRTQRESPRGLGEDDAAEGFAWRARGLAVGGVVVALLLQVALPDGETHFLTRGLGRGPATAQGRGGAASFRSDVDVTRNLTAQGGQVVLTYRTTDPAMGPLHVATATSYRDGHWEVNPPDDRGVPLRSGQDAAPALEVAGPTPATARHVLDVMSSSVAAPQVAAAGWPLRLTGDAAARRSPDGVVSVDSRPEKGYQLTYTSIVPRPGDLDGTLARDLPVDDSTRALNLPPGATVADTARRVVADTRWAPNGSTTTYRQAMALQEYLRNGPFLYSLELLPAPAGPDGRPLDPVSAFLSTRRGYCVQFATAMALMARSLGIPSRVRLGFLPGTSNRDLVSTVRRSDAHMWPELFLPGTGWTRFEPTPGGRSGPAPAYATRAPAPEPSAPARDPESQRARATPTAAPTTTAAPDPAQRPGWSPSLPGPQTLAALGLLLLVALAASVLPALAAHERRRRLAAADTPAARVEASWLSLREQLEDLGLPLADTGTPRDLRHVVAHESSLSEDARAGVCHVIDQVEQARYAPPSARVEDVDIAPVVAAVASGRDRRTRLRARLYPTTGRFALRRMTRPSHRGRATERTKADSTRG